MSKINNKSKVNVVENEESEMVQIRKLLNPIILNAGWVGFCGDSEFESEDEAMLGYWAFLDAVEINDVSGFLTLDDEIDSDELFGGVIVDVVNDKGLLCKVKFTY